MKDMLSLSADAFIQKAADVASTIGMLSGTSAMELAGQIVSVLAAHPEHIDRFMLEGGELLHDGTLAIENGCLSYMSIGGEIRTPSDIRKRKGLEQ